MLVHINRAADYISICFPKFFFSPGTSCLTIHFPFLELHLYRMQKKSVASPLSWAFSQLTNLNSDNEDPIDFISLFCAYELMHSLLLLSHFSRVQLCVIPQTSAHQAPPSLGSSRQEHWGGLPFPSPMSESEK